jgi:two-component system nitrogen regulation response regulator NtrX
MADDILIVDDEKDIRSLLSMTLEDEGYATLQAANADEERRALQAQPPK